ncbi:MAG TPA: cyclic nucleotide-binding domain-containing protein [bacterium]|nr:cyclic nucleotide-binding domain-containing protein [bacterium]HPN30007.1 cyclic nucleotide-binding domain-containing protein [bacterium]
MNITEKIKDFKLFENIPHKIIEEIVNSSIIKDYEAGQIIYEPNSLSDAMFLIVRGKARIFGIVQDMEMTIRDLNEGELIGEESLFTETGKTAGAKALEKSVLLILYRDDMLELIKSNPEAAAQFFKVMITDMSLRISDLDKRLQKVVDWGLKE